MESRSATPPANIYEAGGELSVAVPIPGAHPNHVDVIVQARRLRIEAVSKYPQGSQNYLRRDWRVGAWTLDLELPKAVDPARSRATLNLGVLVVMAPLGGDGEGGEHRPTVEGADT
jgi:HSP20 family molecular chaperone IbpA